MEVNGAVIVVTGASSGIGEATAKAAGRAGARVALLARRAGRIRALADGMGDATAVECDVTDAAQVARAIDAVITRYGRIDALVNNAGQGLQSAVEHIDLDDFRALLDLNVVAPLRMMQAVLPAMRRQGGGSIVNVSSGATFRAMAGSGAYTSTKTALNMLSDVARIELSDAGIAVSTMYPFITSTEFYGAVRAGSESANAVLSWAAGAAQSPDLVADSILGLIRSGEPRADLVPTQFGGSYSAPSRKVG